MIKKARKFFWLFLYLLLMKSISKIVNEEVRSFIREIDETMDDMFEARDNITTEIFQDFLYKNNQDFTKNITWQVAPYPRLKKIWEDYMRMGIVRDVKGIDNIERIIIRAALRLSVITEIAGHTSYGNGEEMIEEHIGYWVNQQMACIFPQEEVNTDQLEIPYNNPAAGYQKKEPVEVEKCDTQIHPFAQRVVDEKFNPDNMDREDARGLLMDAMNERLFDYYLTDPKSGHLYISDYGLPAIEQLAAQLYGETSPEQKVVTIDKILNVVHQRSDLASWFVEGGSRALSDLSGYNVPEDKEDPYSDEVSAISGKYKMGEYR
jgi:hypothetical protein